MGMLLHQWPFAFPTFTFMPLSASPVLSEPVPSAPLPRLLLSDPLPKASVAEPDLSKAPVDRSEAPARPVTCLLRATQRRPRLASSLAGSSMAARWKAASASSRLELVPPSHTHTS